MVIASFACTSEKNKRNRDEGKRREKYNFLDHPHWVTLFSWCLTVFFFFDPEQKISYLSSGSFVHPLSHKQHFSSVFGLIFICWALFSHPARTSQSTEYITSLSYHLKANKTNQASCLNCSNKKQQHLLYAINKIGTRAHP